MCTPRLEPPPSSPSRGSPRWAGPARPPNLTHGRSSTPPGYAQRPRPTPGCSPRVPRNPGDPPRWAGPAQYPPLAQGNPRDPQRPEPRLRAHLARGHLLPLGDLEQEPVVLELERADTVDVVRQAVIELAQLLLLLQPRQARGRQRRGGPARAAGQRRGHGGGGGGGGGDSCSGPALLGTAAAARRAHSIRAADQDGARRPPPQSGLGLVVCRGCAAASREL